METKDKLDGGNGACDDQNFNWQTGEQGAAKYMRLASLPGEAEGDAGKYLKSADELINIKPVKRLGSIEVRKPKKQEWFRSHPQMVVELHVIRKESSGDFYAIDPELVSELSAEVREAFLSACISNEGALFLWPILKPKGDGVGLQLYENDLADLSLSRSTWIRRQWATGPKNYKVDEANSQKVPEWPENQNIVDWVNKGFRGRFIDDLNHQLLCQLRGEL
jgi:hypothetical protein